MFIRTPIAVALTAAALLTASGCAVTRGQESTGAYMSDAGITTTIKARFVENVPEMRKSDLALADPLASRVCGPEASQTPRIFLNDSSSQPTGSLSSTIGDLCS